MSGPTGETRRLESLRRRGGERTRAKLAGKTVRIWSGEHRAWWRPNRSGYTADPAAAGLYAFEDARRASGHCCPRKRIVYEIVKAEGEGRRMKPVEEKPTREESIRANLTNYREARSERNRLQYLLAEAEEKMARAGRHLRGLGAGDRLAGEGL